MSAWLRHHGQSLFQTLQRLGASPVATGLNLLVIGIALALPLGAYALLANVQGLLAGWPAAGQVSIFLDPAATRQDAQEVQTRLRSQPGVRDVRFVSRESALAVLKRSPELGDIVGSLRQNPLPDALVVALADRETAAADRLATLARSLPKVSHVQSDAAWARRLDALIGLGRSGVALLASLLGVALVAVTFNTIRLQILTQRTEIEVSKLVGATDAFIRRPFFYLGALQGGFGGLLALGIVTGSLAFLDRDVAALAQSYGSRFRLSGPGWQDGMAVMAFAALLGWLGAYLSVSRHLHQIEPR